LLRYKKAIPCYEGSEAQEQVAQRSCGCPSLAVFKARLDGALSNLVWWKVSLPVAGGLELGDLQGPFRPKPFCDSIIDKMFVGLFKFLSRSNLQ